MTASSSDRAQAFGGSWSSDSGSSDSGLSDSGLSKSRKIVRQRRVRSLTALAAVGVMALGACGQKPSEQAATSTKPLVVGISLPLTGDFSQPGGEAKRGYEV
ncbi:MAG: hypothetical protein QOF35_2189, partial [Actinomycetota bacterium]|nr:hypothetical protein [Actinomycetota bacterium]